MKHELWWAAGLALCCSACSTQPKQAPDERPNILFILSDDHTSQAWGIYGGILADYVKNENIRRLAAEGCVLDHCFCTNSISVPSRASILTGAYSHRTGVYTLGDALEPATDNIAKRLQEGGYQTALIGKWHLKKKPTGFDYFNVFHDQGDYVDPVFKTDSNWVDDTEGKHGVQQKGFSTDLVTDQVMDWIRQRDPNKPFLMCCHFKATHEPWDFPERMKHLYDDVVFPEPASMMEFGTETSGRAFPGQQLENMGWRWETASAAPDQWWCRYPELPFSTKGLSREEARHRIYQKMIRDYLRCGATIDDNIGRLLQLLDQEGLTENTVVVYVSDQGYFLGEHGMFDKRMMYEQPLRMPFVIRYPKEIPAGTRNADMILNIDFASLLADYAQVDEPELAQGRSFRENLKGHTPTDWRKDMYYRYWTHHRIRPAHMGIRNERYKLMYLYGDPLHMTDSEAEPTAPAWEFHDLQVDPYEDHNLIDDPKYADVIRTMKQRMLELRRACGDTDASHPRMQELLQSLEADTRLK
ncbi:mucin-desulfating sulfatase (N-acetylglucosamine-6-sulfatase) [gut metagenome]|uniref:Mucin-desulfating sulfatase (N-acetylglucosamine-6-sulfatase) n=1 Tax=gut metagenome TaxID=749906 RepID=J9GCX9_9ZZZZ